MYNNIDFSGLKRKGSKDYVSNPQLLEELKKSRERGQPTDAFTKMIILIARNLSKRMPYIREEDRDDCISFAIMDCLAYYKSFDENKSKNAFAYLTSICSNGFAKAWRKLGYHDFPLSKITRLDTGNIHSL